MLTRIQFVPLFSVAIALLVDTCIEKRAVESGVLFGSDARDKVITEVENKLWRYMQTAQSNAMNGDKTRLVKASQATKKSKSSATWQTFDIEDFVAWTSDIALSATKFRLKFDVPMEFRAEANPVFSRWVNEQANALIVAHYEKLKVGVARVGNALAELAETPA